MVPMDAAPFVGVWRGLMRRRRLTDHPELYGWQAKNVELLGNVIAKRRGTKRLSTTPLDGRVHALFQAKWRSGSGTDEVLAAAGAAIQAVGDPPSADRVILANLPAGTPARTSPTKPAHFAQLNNTVFFCDGTNALNLKYRYVGGVPTVQKWGIDAPVAAPAIGALAGTGLTLAFGRKYRATFVNTSTQHESEPGPESASTGAVANKTVPVTAPASTDPQVDAARIYATTDGGEGIWLYVGETTPGGTLMDTVDDEGLGSFLEEFVNDPPPDRMRLVVAWPSAGRLLGVAEDSPSILRYTDLVVGRLKPEAWPPENIVPITVDMGDEIVAVYPFVDSVLVIGRRSVWRLRGLPPDLTLEPVQFHPARTAIGGFGQHALVQVDDLLVNPFLDGAYAVGRFQDLQGGFTTTRMSRAIDDLWTELNQAAARASHAVFVRGRRQVRMFIPHGTNAEPTRCLVLQLDVAADGDAPGGWTVWEILAPNGAPAQITASVVVETASGDACYVGTADGYVLQMDQGFEDSWSGASVGNGAAYEMLWETVPFALREDEGDVRMRFLDVVVRPETQAVITITPRTDFGTDWPGISLSVAPGAAFVLGQSMLDTGHLGGVATYRKRCAILTRGTYNALRFRNVEKGVSFAIERWTVRWQPLAVKARSVDVLQTMPSFLADSGDGFGEGPFNQGGFG